MNLLTLKIDKKEAFFILGILLAAFFVRLIYLKDYLRTAIYPVLTDSDAYCYYVWARDIVSGDILGHSAFMKWPLYAYFLALIFKAFGDKVFLVYAVQFLLGALNCVLVYFIARKIFNAVVGFIAASLCVFYGLFVFYDSLLIYISLSLFLNSLLFLSILFIKDNPTRKRLFFIGVFLGVCALTQANIILFGILVIIWILGQNRLSLRSCLNRFFYFLLGLTMVVGIATTRNYIAEKDLVLISGNLGVNFYLGNNPQASGIFHSPEYLYPSQEKMFKDAKLIAQDSLKRKLKTSEVSNFWIGKAWNFIKRNPGRYLELLIKKVFLVFSPEEFIHDSEYPYIANGVRIMKVLLPDLRFILPLSLLGAILCLKKLKTTAPILIILITLSGSIVLFFAASRYRILLVPYLLILASWAIFRVYGMIKTGDYRKSVLSVASLIVLYFIFNNSPLFRIKDSALSRDFALLNYHLRNALVYIKKADYQEAMHEAVSAQEIYPRYPQTIFTLGLIHYYQNNFIGAKTEFKRLININPLYIDAYYNLGVIYNKEKRYQEAIEVLNRAKSLDEEDVAVHYELGRAFKASKEFAKAKEEFNIVLHKISRWRTQDIILTEAELKSLTR